MDRWIRILVSLFLAVSLIGAGPVMTQSAEAQETLAIESAQNSQPAPENMSSDVARMHFLFVQVGRPRSFAWLER